MCKNIVNRMKCTLVISSKYSGYALAGTLCLPVTVTVTEMYCALY